MCGIAGVFGKPDIATVKAMIAKLSHRGPDDEHLVSGTDFCLGAARLSIVGVEDGRQPIANETATIWAAQNGELYNYPLILPQLEARGHKLKTRCDTEILPHLYEEYGIGLVEHIDGMFAAAIWDDVNKVGVLARDRMGKKPLYYFKFNDAIYFASEIKALLLVPDFERRINFEALNNYLSFKHIPCPFSIFEGIQQLPPAHVLVFRIGQEVEVKRYWDIDFSSNNELEGVSEEELTDKLIELLRNGIRRRLMSDVPIGFFLSGGIDSGLSTTLAAEISTERVKTFTLTYSDGSTTEGKESDRKWARWIAHKYGTDHHEEEIQYSSFPENLRNILACFDEPFAGTVSTYFLAGLISKHVKVAISGDGADELFGSYLSHRLAFPLARYQQYLETGDSKLITPFESEPDRLAHLYEQADWVWRSKLLVYGEAEKGKLLSSDVLASMPGLNASERLKQDFANLTATCPLNRMLEAEFRTLLPDQVLTFVDRLSMAHSLEVRTAYLDTELVEFAAKLPGTLKIRNGETKYLLKKAALRYFPDEMVFRNKEGFFLPVADWLLNDLEGYVRETLGIDRLRQHNLFNSSYIQGLVNDFYSKSSDYTHANKLFVLIAFQEWYEQYMNCSKKQLLSSTTSCNM